MKTSLLNVFAIQSIPQKRLIIKGIFEFFKSISDENHKKHTLAK